MRSRCPIAIKIKNYKLNSLRFIINSRGVASLIEDTNSSCEGILWEITPSCEQSLDKYEGVSWGTYHKKYFDIDDLGMPTALLYLAKDNIEVSPSKSNYMLKICKSAKAQGLSSDYVDFLEGYCNEN